jgi:hypothetical protein
VKYIVLLLLIAPALLAKDDSQLWRQDGQPVANTESRKSIDGFGAAALVTSDSDWEAKWNTPASETPKFTEVHRLMRGDRAWVLIFFANPSPDERSWVDVVCDIKTTRPNGKVTEDKGLKAMKAQLNGPATNTFLAEPVIGFVGDDSDPVGDWIFDVVVRDLNKKISIPVRVKFTLISTKA